ncbi:MAG: hypothetical protein J4431_01155 [Candidatus Aenigmarchaeota archaeon]|nr:hypothetical protein [Candidatus Aenigmarchaeota archaeon]
MNAYDKALLGLYVISLFAIIALLSDVWALAAILVLILMVSLVQKAAFEDEIIRESDRHREAMVQIAARLELFSRKLEEIRYDVGKGFYAFDSRLKEARVDYQKDMDMNYRELSRKLYEVENRLTAARRTFASALGAMDDRINSKDEEETYRR